MALRVDLEWTSACTGLALGQGEVPGGTGQGQIDPRSLDFNLGEVGYKSWEQKLKKKKKPIFFSVLHILALSFALLTPEP